jgi:hypothetical protein
MHGESRGARVTTFGNSVPSSASSQKDRTLQDHCPLSLGLHFLSRASMAGSSKLTLGRHEEETFWEDVIHLMASAVEALKQRILIRRTVGPHSKPGAPHDETEELAFSNVEVENDRDSQIANGGSCLHPQHSFESFQCDHHAGQDILSLACKQGLEMQTL